MAKKKRGGRGRPRDPNVDALVLDVALSMLARDGYKRMSMDAVAHEAGVTKPTIYRRWPSKADLATAALSRLQRSESVPVGGNAREKLVSILRNFQKSLLRPNGMAMIGTLLAEERHTPDLVRLFRERIVGHRRAQIREVLEHARRHGELRSDVDVDASVNMLIGAFYARYLAEGRVPRGWAERVVDVYWACAQKP